MMTRPLFDSPPTANAKLGTLLQAVPKNKGGEHTHKSTPTKMEGVENQAPTLEELGIDRKPRPGSKTPTLLARAKTPPEIWRIELSGHNRDGLPPVVVRIRKVLKNAGRCYRLRARIIAQPGPAVAMDNSTSSQSINGQPMRQTKANDVPDSLKTETAP